MYRKIKKGTVLLLVGALLLSALVFASGAAGADSYPAVTLRRGSNTLSVTGRRIEGKTFVPLRDFTALFTKATYRYDATSEYATLTATGLVIEAGRGATYLFANGRCLYGVAANRLIDGQLWVPLNPLAKALGLTVGGADTASQRTVGGSYRALTPASQYYNADELYWLSRIISAESRGEPIRGQIAVGNTVLNRVRSSSFPNTIYGVIFQRGQFAPVLNGTIYNTPAWSSVTAAKMCLEGYAIDNGTLYFCNIATSTSSWIVKNRTRAFTIGAHTFFY